MKFFSFLFSLFCALSVNAYSNRWSVERAQEWYRKQGWLIGCNFIPSTAENTIEMWQEETFDAATIDTELAYAELLGFNIVRVFTHWLVWQQDPAGYLQRLDTYLDIANSHGIKTMFVLFDDCWNKEAHLGAQEPPIPGVHNSRWVQCPGDLEVTNTTLHPTLASYVIQTIRHFHNDSRVIIWDLYNEPGNTGHRLETMPLLKNVFSWARIASPSQPVTAGVWHYDDNVAAKFNEFQINNSDIVTFHTYSDLDSFKGVYELVREHSAGRPCICSEYMARPFNCTFKTHLPFLKETNIGAINWGLVSGKTQTIFPWGSPPYSPTPKIWFHDIFNKDGTPFDASEAEFIRNITRARV